MEPFKKLRMRWSSGSQRSASQEHQEQVAYNTKFLLQALGSTSLRKQRKSAGAGHSPPTPAAIQLNPAERPKGLTVLENFATCEIPPCSWDRRVEYVTKNFPVGISELFDHFS